jgi:L-fuconate dehydratase
MFKQFFVSRGLGVCQVDVCRVGGVNEGLAVLLMAAKYGIPVCPHAGGVGLCEVEQHISIFDYLRLGTNLENRMLEHVDHLHEHFVTPAQVVGGRYRIPEAPGFSTELLADSLDRFAYPDGPEWNT